MSGPPHRITTLLSLLALPAVPMAGLVVLITTASPALAKLTVFWLVIGPLIFFNRRHFYD